MSIDFAEKTPGVRAKQDSAVLCEQPEIGNDAWCWLVEPFEARAIFFRLCQESSSTEFNVGSRQINLSLRCPPRRCRLEVNGVEIDLDQEISVLLKQERPGCFICMDSLKVFGEFHFEVLYETERLMHASLKPFESSKLKPSITSDVKNDFPFSFNWLLECWLCKYASCPGGCSDEIPWSVELNVVGQFDGKPIYLTETARADLRTKRPRRVSYKQQRSNLQVIAEHEKEEDQSRQEETSSGEEPPLWDPSVFDPDLFEQTYQRLGGVGVEEVGQITWFNAGLRVGMGIGLGVCLGMGLGVGILTRTYQRTKDRVTNLGAWVSI